MRGLTCINLKCIQNSTGIYELLYIDQLIVPLDLLEGYANFTMNNNGKFEESNKQFNKMKHIGKSPDLHVISVQSNLSFQAFQVNFLNYTKSGPMNG